MKTHTIEFEVSGTVQVTIQGDNLPSDPDELQRMLDDREISISIANGPNVHDYTKPFPDSYVGDVIDVEPGEDLYHENYRVVNNE